MERLVQLIKGEEPKITLADDEDEDIEPDLEAHNLTKPAAGDKTKDEDSDDDDLIIEEI